MPRRNSVFLGEVGLEVEEHALRSEMEFRAAFVEGFEAAHLVAVVEVESGAAGFGLRVEEGGKLVKALISRSQSFQLCGKLFASGLIKTCLL